jgi:hypothetical protein
MGGQHSVLNCQRGSDTGEFGSLLQIGPLPMVRASVIDDVLSQCVQGGAGALDKEWLLRNGLQATIGDQLFGVIGSSSNGPSSIRAAFKPQYATALRRTLLAPGFAGGLVQDGLILDPTSCQLLRCRRFLVGGVK